MKFETKEEYWGKETRTMVLVDDEGNAICDKCHERKEFLTMVRSDNRYSTASFWCLSCVGKQGLQEDYLDYKTNLEKERKKEKEKEDFGTMPPITPLVKQFQPDLNTTADQILKEWLNNSTEETRKEIDNIFDEVLGKYESDIINEVIDTYAKKNSYSVDAKPLPNPISDIVKEDIEKDNEP
jgi:hypothetical protein